MNNVRSDAGTSTRPSFFEKKDPWGQGLSLWVLALILFLAPVAIFSLRHVRLDNNVEKWLPANDPSALEYAWCREHFPGQHVMFLTWEGSTLDDPRLPILIGELHGKVDEDGVRRGGVPYVSSVMHAGNLLTRMTELGVDQSEAVRRLQGTMIGRGALKVRLTSAGDAQREEFLERITADAKRQLGLSVQIQKPLAPWTPNSLEQGAFQAQQARFGESAVAPELAAAAVAAPHDFQISWQEMSADPDLLQRFISWTKSQTAASGEPLVEDCFVDAVSPIAVVVGLSDAGVAEPVKAMNAIKKAAIQSFVPAEKVVLGGSPVLTAELNAAVIRAAFNPQAPSPFGKSVIGLSGLVGIIFALISLRNVKLGLLVVGVAYYSALLGMAVVPLSGGTMNMVLVVLPTLLMVLSLSGAIHIANYWKHAVWEDPKTAVTRATKMAYEPCMLASLTTALGLISLGGSQLAPVRDFGIYASIGTMISVGMILYGLPSLLQMMPQVRVRPGEVDARFWRSFGAVMCRNWRLTMTLSIGLSLLCTAGLMRFQVETKVIRYFPEKSQVVKDFKWMEDSLAGICPVEIVVRFDEEAQKSTRFLERLELVRRIEDNIRAHSEVSGTVSLADFLPQRDPPGAESSPRDKIVYNRRSHETEDRVKLGQSEGAGELLAMSNRTPRPDDPKRAGADELWRINAQCSIVNDVDYGILTQELHDCVKQVTAGTTGIDHFVTGTVPLFLQTQRAVLDSLIWSFVMAFGLIAAVMIWVLKDFVAGAISMLPNILPVLMVFGLVSWCGQRIDIGTMVTASIALGISVDGTLHLLTWFQDGIRKGMTRQQAVLAALAHCGPAMWQTSAAVGIGLLVLFPAELLLISRFGWLMAALIGTALLGDIILLPALLVGPMGKIIQNGLQRRGEIRPVVETSGDLPVPAPHFAPVGNGVEQPRVAG
ncbi:efflux RND transporter permease subunit [Planctomicrobium sp. SH661]|uniref:efflux RND transporter permease subunit n=1 Tax=Planctomicrobium sp. SH661 TaxID=3448124 RepID=UPI003F5C5DFC